MDDESSVVQSLYSLLHPCQRVRQVDVHLDDQVLTTPLELVVRLLVEDDDDVPRLQSGLLVPFAAECNLLAVLHSLVHLDLQDLPLPVHLPPVTLLTPELGVDPLALTMTLLDKS